MSGFGREAVYVALETFLAAALEGSPTPPVTLSRSAQHYSNVAAEEMPAVFILQKGESAVRKRGLNAKVTLQCVLLIYTTGSNDSSVAASTAINNIIDTIDNALDPDNLPGNVQQLGLPGVVEHAWIEGKVEIFEAILVATSIAIVPIHILCTG